jgi:hypothetical protein
MNIEKVTMTDRTPDSIWQKLNPVWWLVGPDGWDVPTINNGTPYIPEVTNIWMRRFYWFICRNPLMNFVGKVIGVEDKNYTAYGPNPVLLATLRDTVPLRTGWKWSVLFAPFSPGALAVAVVATLLSLVWWPAAIVAIFAALKIVGPLPYVAYWGGRVETYLGWRPGSGGYGFKFVLRAKG